MLAIDSYPAEFATTDGRGRKDWHSCEVVGICGEPDDMQFIIIVRGPVEYIDRVAEVRRRTPSTVPFG
jgi:hypothetical protein